MALDINKEAIIKFKPNEIGILLSALAKVPYEQVAQTIFSIEQQLMKQFPNPDIQNEISAGEPEILEN